MDKNNSAQTNTWVDHRLAMLNPAADWQPDVTASLARFRKLQAAQSSTGRITISKRWLLAATVSIAVCFGLLASPSPKVFAHRCLECSIAVWQSLAPAAPVQATLTPVDARAIAPDFILKDANDRDVKLSTLKGKVVLVNFWATWCEGCQVEIPWFVAFEKQYENRGLVVVGISMDDDGWKSVKPWLKEKKVNYPIVIGYEALAKLYGLDGMPLTALVDRDGRVADSHSGLVDKSATDQKIRALLLEASKTVVN